MSRTHDQPHKDFTGMGRNFAPVKCKDCGKKQHIGRGKCKYCGGKLQ